MQNEINLHTIQLSKENFNLLGSYIESNYGIKMPPGKKALLEGRIRKRLRVLRINSFEEYCKYVFSPEGLREELVHMVDVVTTNKTSFFREPSHFEILPKVIESFHRNDNHTLKVWSAGCSTGEEPYTLAMVLSEIAEKINRFQFTILGTDLCTEVLKKAEIAIYSEESISSVPPHLRHKYLLKNKDPSKKVYRISPIIRNLVTFQKVNFMDEFDLKVKMDIIFCRNVMIYFDKVVQRRLVNRFLSQLRSDGVLFLGHSETLCASAECSLRIIAPTVYQKIK